MIHKFNEQKQTLLQFLTKVEFNSAGHIVYDINKKKLNKPGHPDNTPINSQTTVLKTQVDNNYIIIDADSCDLSKLEELYPSIANTFTTRTTDTNKRHYWFNNTRGLGGVRKTGLELDGMYDIITTGIIYEAHTIKGQLKPWKILNKVKPIDLTDKELDLIEQLTSYSTLPQNPNRSFFVNKEVKTLLQKVVDAESFKPGKKHTLTNAEHNKLLRGIMNEEFRQAHKSNKDRVDYPPFNYMSINTMAYKLSYNAVISFTQRDLFLRIVLREQYNINPDTQLSQQYLDRQILGTLPQHESLLENTDDYHLKDLIKHTDIAGWGLVKFVEGKDIVFMEVNTSSLKPRKTGIADQPFISLKTVLDDRLYSKEDIQLVPRVRVVDDPYKPRTAYDLDNDIDIINLSNNSRYVEEALPSHTLSDSPVKRLIYSYFSPESADIYLHWLAHCTYGSRSPQTVLCLVSDPDDMSGVGKSLLTQAIPQKLIDSAVTAKMDGIDKWGNMVLGKRLVVFNDMQKMAKLDWARVTSFIRDRTTGGTKRLDDVKYGMPITSTNAVAFAMSANHIPSIEDHDRRWWIELPAQIYGSPPTQKCNSEDATWYRRNLEMEHGNYLEEVQKLANYLKYLYEEKQDKYETYLYERAPETLGLEIAKRNSITYSEQLPKLISQGPAALLSLFEPDSVIEWIPFILFQTHGEQCALSWRFFADMLHTLHPDSADKTSPTKVATSMQIDKSKFTTRSHVFNLYRDRAALNKQGIEPSYAEYPMAAMLLTIDVAVIEDYRHTLEELQNGRI